MEFNQKKVSIRSVVSMKSFSNIDLSTLVKRKIPSENNNFTYSLLPIYFFSRAIGLLPFSIIRDSSGRVREARLSVFDCLWFIISISGYLFLAWFCYQKTVVSYDPNESFVLNIGDNMLLIFGLLYGAIIITMDLGNRNKLVEILKNFTAFDDAVSIHKSS